MVRVLGKLLIFFLVLFVFLRYLPPIPISSTVTQKQDLFSVSGEGKVTVVPDTALVSLGVQINKPTVVAAQQQANTVINDVSAALKQLGVVEKDIKTSNYSVWPQYDYVTGTNKISSYQVNVSLLITVRDMAKINSVVDTATQKGVNTISGIELTVDESKQKQLLQEARELAVKEAKSKAESLAKAAGLTLGRIVNVQESGLNSVPSPRLLMDKAVGMGGGGSTDIQAGSTDITSSVTLSYETR